jgi:hypothetical protein
VLALASCAGLAKLGELQTDLSSAGYTATRINQNTTNGHDLLNIEVTTESATTIATDEDADRIAEIVWTKYPAEVDELVVIINGRPMMDASSDELAGRFGERPAGLTSGDGGDSGDPTMLIVIVVVAALLLAGLFVLIWWRGRRPPPQVAPPMYYQGP